MGKGEGEQGRVKEGREKEKERNTGIILLRFLSPLCLNIETGFKSNLAPDPDSQIM